MLRRTLLLLTGCATGLIASGVACADEKITFGTDWLAEAEHGGFYEALALGLYKKHGLDVTIRMGGPQNNPPQQIAAGVVDFQMSSGSFGALSMAQQSIPVIAVAAYFQKDPQVLISHPGVGDDTLAEMKGKPIMISAAARNGYWLFLKAKFGFADSQIRPYTFSLAPFLADPHAIQQGFVSSEPYQIERVSHIKPVVNLLADNGYASYSNVVLTQERTVKERPAVVKAFLEASTEGWYNYIYGDPKPGNDLIRKDNPDMTQDTIDNAIKVMKSYGIVDSGDSLTLGLGAMTDARWKSFFDTMAQAGLYKPDLDYKKAYTLQFVDQKYGMEFEAALTMGETHVLRGARLADRDDLVDIAIRDGCITAITPAGEAATGASETALRGGLVFPGFVDLHTHLDKGHIWPRAENPDGTFLGALTAVMADRRKSWTAADVARRFDFGLRCAHAHGTVAIRTHIDSLAPQFRISWPVFAEMRERWRDRIALQGVAIVGLALLDDAAYAADLAACLVEHGGIMGAVIHPMERLGARIDGLLRLATTHGLGLDVHIDETLDAGARSLPILAERAMAHRFPHPIVVGHCCSLAMQDEAEADRTMDLMAAARMQVVSLPMCNLYLQDRVPGRTPRRRGVTLLHELRARGIPVAVASDNCRDPFYAYGDHDLLEVFREAVRIAHLDRPFGDWHEAVTGTPASIMGIEAGRVCEGAVADLVLFRARTMNELLSRPQSDRVVLRAGVTVTTTVPDYAELDDITG